MSIKSKFSKAIYYSRLELGMTQAQVAESLNISVRWYQIIENGRCLPSAELTLRIIAFFGIDGNLLRNEDCILVQISDL